MQSSWLPASALIIDIKMYMIENRFFFKDRSKQSHIVGTGSLYFFLKMEPFHLVIDIYIVLRANS